MTVQVQSLSAPENMSNRSRLPLQPRNPNVYGSSTSLSSADPHMSNLESSNNDINKARIMNSSSSLRSSNHMGYPVELGDEHEASLVTHTGTFNAPPPVLKRTVSNTSGGSGPVGGRSLESPVPDVKPRVPVAPATSASSSSNNPESDHDIVVEEKRKRINGEGYTIHRYLRGRLLGKGGFAKVFMCTALDTNKQYAVKVVPKANLVKTRARQKVSSFSLYLVSCRPFKLIQMY